MIELTTINLDSDEIEKKDAHGNKVVDLIKNVESNGDTKMKRRMRMNLLITLIQILMMKLMTTPKRLRRFFPVINVSIPLREKVALLSNNKQVKAFYKNDESGILKNGQLQPSSQ